MWPVSASEPTAAAARLDGFQMAAKALHLSAVAIVPEDSLVPSGNGESSTVSAKLYDSYARRGPVYAMLGLPFSTLQLLRLLRKLESRCVVASTPSPFIPFQALIASRILNVGYVLDVRDSWEMETITHQGLLRNVVKQGWGLSPFRMRTYSGEQSALRRMSILHVVSPWHVSVRQVTQSCGTWLNQGSLASILPIQPSSRRKQPEYCRITTFGRNSREIVSTRLLNSIEPRYHNVP